MMLNDSARQYLQFTQRHAIVVNYVGIICSCGDRSDTMYEWENHIARELEKAGLEMVELPQPNPATGIWDAGNLAQVETDGGDVRLHFPSPGDMFRYRSPSKARQLALALLSASREVRSHD